jgi:hypothetical protein
VRFAATVPQHVRSVVTDACNAWGVHGYIKCVPYNGQSRSLLVTANHSGCWASYGSSTEARLNLDTLVIPSPSIPSGTCATNGIAMHELGHVLGLIHEHQRADRDQYVTIHTENLVNTTNHQILTSTIQGPYDFQSIMHYTRYNSSANGQPTMSVKPAYAQFQNVIGQTVISGNPQLSAQDQAFARTAYPRPIRGYIDSAILQPNGTVVIAGWGCELGSPNPIATHTYVGATSPTTLLGAVTANLPSEAAIATQCEIASGPRRYRYVMTAAQRAAHLGKRIWVFGISSTGSGNPAFSNSASIIVP